MNYVHIMRRAEIVRVLSILVTIVGAAFLSHSVRAVSGVKHEGHTNRISTVGFSSDGKTIYSGSNDGTVKLWDVASGRELRTFEIYHERPFQIAYQVQCAALSPDGKQVLAGSSYVLMQLWNVATGKTVRIFNAHEGTVEKVIFSPNGQTIASTGSDGVVKVWNTQTGRVLHSFAQDSRDNSIAFLASGTKLLVVNDSIDVWDLTSGKRLSQFQLKGNLIARSMAVSPDGETVLINRNSFLTEQGDIGLWSLITGKLIRRFPAYPYNSSDLVAAFDSGIAAITVSLSSKTGNREIVTIWSISTGTVIRQFVAHESPIAALAFSPDGKTLVTGSYDATLKLWKVATGDEIRRFPLDANKQKSLS